jgi:hypothetical protein
MVPPSVDVPPSLCPLHSTSVNCLSGLLLDCEGSLGDERFQMGLVICRRLNINSPLIPIVGWTRSFKVRWKAACS